MNTILSFSDFLNEMQTPYNRHNINTPIGGLSHYIITDGVSKYKITGQALKRLMENKWFEITQTDERDVYEFPIKKKPHIFSFLNRFGYNAIELK